MTNVNVLLRDHVSLIVECLDRIYLTAYIPTWQVPGQLVRLRLGRIFDLPIIGATRFPLQPRCAVLPSHSLIASRPSPESLDL